MIGQPIKKRCVQNFYVFTTIYIRFCVTYIQKNPSIIQMKVYLLARDKTTHFKQARAIAEISIAAFE